MIRVVLPAYNEASSLKELLPDLVKTFRNERLSYNITVVDDGSTDDTAKVVHGFSQQNRKVKLIKHKHNKGLAETINTGFRSSLKRSSADDIVITMDADNTHLPGLILRMIRLISEGHDIVICSRYLSGSRLRGVPVYRQALSLVASIMFRTLFPIQGVKDYTCGYRAYRSKLVNKAFKKYGKNFISEKGFSCMVDILLKLRRFDPICTEVPMILRYDFKKGKSKMHVGQTIKDSLFLIKQHLLVSNY